MNYLYKFLLLSLTILYGTCGSAKKSNTNRMEVFQKYQKGGYQCEYNKDSTLLLCIPGYQSTANIKEVIVLKTEDNSVVYKENIQFPEVNWVDSCIIEINRSLGITNGKNGREVYRINLETQEKIWIYENVKDK